MSTSVPRSSRCSPTPRLVAGASALLLALGALAASSPVALAAESSESASVGAYFFQAGIDKPDALPAAPPNAPAALDGVAPEHLAVAVSVPSRPDKKSFLAFDLLGVDPEASISKAVVRVPLAPSSPNNQQVAPAPEKVRACMAGDEGFNGEDGASFEGAPAEKCDEFEVVATLEAGGAAYLFDITELAQTWLSGTNDGLALTPSTAGLGAPFQVVFLPFSESTIKVSSSGGGSAEEPPSAPDEEPAFEEPAFEEPAAEEPFVEEPFAEEPAVEEFAPETDVAPEPAVEDAAPEVAPDNQPIAPVAAAPLRRPDLSDRGGFGLAFWSLAGLDPLGGLALARVVSDPGTGPAAPTRIGTALDARTPGSNSLLGERTTT